jgi:hypothetical protein
VSIAHEAFTNMTALGIVLYFDFGTGYVAQR